MFVKDIENFRQIQKLNPQKFVMLNTSDKVEKLPICGFTSQAIAWRLLFDFQW